MRDYADFVSQKLSTVPSTGITGSITLPDSLFPHQHALSLWALRRGRAAIFADTGLGKMRMELVFADAVHKHTGRPFMIHTPLAVAWQLAEEAKKMGLHAQVCREAGDLIDGINIANYQRMHKFDASIFGGVALDESSCIKHHDTGTFKALATAYRDTPFKLPATATPSPNDWTELGTHAEFLGVCTRQEMLAEFFTHDGGDTSVWRLKGHARHVFWRWVASWGAMIRRPSDLGFDDSAYVLPPLHVHEHLVDYELPAAGQLFSMEAQTLSERRDARRASMAERVDACAKQVNAEPGKPWVVWCDLNAEGDALTDQIKGAVQLSGADSTDRKEEILMAFARREITRLVSKPSICGWGLNWQHARRQAFVGVTDSYEAYYQAVRRSWRFGQTEDVHVYLFASKAEGSVLANLKRKERDAQSMADSLSAETRDAVMQAVTGQTRQTNDYNAAKRVTVPAWMEQQREQHH